MAEETEGEKRFWLPAGPQDARARERAEAYAEGTRRMKAAELIGVLEGATEGELARIWDLLLAVPPDKVAGFRVTTIGEIAEIVRADLATAATCHHTDEVRPLGMFATDPPPAEEVTRDGA